MFFHVFSWFTLAFDLVRLVLRRCQPWFTVITSFGYLTYQDSWDIYGSYGIFMGYSWKLWAFHWLSQFISWDSWELYHGVPGASGAVVSVFAAELGRRCTLWWNTCRVGSSTNASPVASATLRWANADGRFPMDKNGGNGKIIRKPPKQMEVSSLNGIIVWLAMFENTGVCCITMKWQFLMISQWMQGGLPSFSPSICRQTHIWGFP